MELIGSYKLTSKYNFELSIFSQSFKFKMQDNPGSSNYLYMIIPYQYIGIRPTVNFNYFAYKDFRTYVGFGTSLFFLIREEIGYGYSYNGSGTFDLAQIGPYFSLSIGTGINYSSKIGKFQLGIRFHSDADSHPLNVDLPNQSFTWVLDKNVFQELLLIETSYYYEF